MTTKMIEKLEAIGAKRWTKNGMDRMYINLDALQVVMDKYNNGVVPMNRRCRDNFKLWINIENGSVEAKNIGIYEEDVIEMVEKYLEEIEAEEVEKVENEKGEKEMKKIINKQTNEVVVEFGANHSMTLDEAIEICGGEIINNANDDRYSEDGDNVLLNGKRYWYDDLDLVYGYAEGEKVKRFVFETYRDRGGIGSEQVFETKEEALKEAEASWYHLADCDKKIYKADDAGLYHVYEVELTEAELEAYNNGELEAPLSEYWSADVKDLLDQE